MDKTILEKIYSHSINNYTEVKQSKICGCFFCQKTFDSSQISNTIKDNSKTAVCPFCGIDAVLGDAAGFSINNKLLNELNKQYFN